MAKLTFKDLIFKYLKQEEPTHSCKKVHPKMSHKEWMNTEPVVHVKEASNTSYKLVDKKTGEVIFTGNYNNVVQKDKDTGYKHKVVQGESYKSDYEKEQPIKVKKAIEIAKRMAGNYTGATKEIEKIAKGLSQLPVVKSVLMRVNEEAPANATGTAVAGTGDDSSTVVVKKKDKEKLQDRLMRRMKIKEAIDRAIPDLEYPKDEIRERTEQLKGFAKEYAMGLQVPATSFMKPVGDLNKGKSLRKTEMTNDVIPQGEMKPLKKKNEISNRLKSKVLKRKISRAKDKFRKGLRRP